MTITFQPIDKHEIYSSHNNCYHDDARYFNVIKDEHTLCIYGVISHDNQIGEAFWITNSFSDKVFSKKFFHCLFNHLFSLQYKEIYTWTRCPRLINVFSHFNNFGIEKVSCPAWDNDPTKTWFMRSL